jgi:hypothetical protein
LKIISYKNREKKDAIFQLKFAYAFSLQRGQGEVFGLILPDNSN